MTISCCKDCKDRKVTADYNCHSHCERYLAETIAHEKERRRIKTQKDKEKAVNSVVIEGYKRKRGKK